MGKSGRASVFSLKPKRARPSGAPRVHARGEVRLDAVLELAQIASRPDPLAEVLAPMCERIASLLAVDVCSVYLRSDGERGAHSGRELVLAATFGYPADAVGRVRMQVGEGLTGFAVECLRPISVERALSDSRNKAFEELNEDRFPSLCALPLVESGRALGALVIQRREPHAFGQREIVLAAAVAAPLVFAVERARLREKQAREEARPTVSIEEDITRPHNVPLRGTGLAPGAALGTVRTRRYVAGRALQQGPTVATDERARVAVALAEVAEEIIAQENSALRIAGPGLRSLLAPARFVLDDARLRERIFFCVEEGAPAELAVERVAREYARVLFSSGDAALWARALEVEALCQRVLSRLAPASRALRPLGPGTVLVASRLTVCDAIELSARYGVGVILAHGKESSLAGIEVASALKLPVVAGVEEIYRWAADGDRALIDGEKGTVVVNPSRIDVIAHRGARQPR